MKTKLAYFLDNTAIFIGIAIIFYIWTKNIIKPSYIQIIISLTISASTTKLIIALKEKSQTKKLYSFTEKNNTKTLIDSLSKMTKKELIERLDSIIKQKFKTQKRTNYLILYKDKSIEQDIDKNLEKPDNSANNYSAMAIIIPMFWKEKTELYDIINEISKIKLKTEKIYIFGINFSELAYTYALNNNSIFLFDALGVYRALSYNFNIEKYIETKQKNSTHIVIKSLLKKSKFSKYFWGGLFLIITSFFIPYSIYYKIVGSVLILLSIVCLFIKGQNTTTHINYFE